MTAVLFFIASYIPFYWHCGILWAFGTVGTLLFIKIDVQVMRSGRGEMESFAEMEKEEDKKGSHNEAFDGVSSEEQVQG